MIRLVTCLSVLLSASTLSADPLTADAFEAYTTGKTLYFSENGEIYGAERYMPGRRVEWSFMDGQCKQGEWYPDDTAICFVYEDRPDPQCWEFERTGSGMRATFRGDGQSTELYEAQELDEPLYCVGPKVGV